MTYFQLKNQLATLTDEQLQQSVCYWGIDHSVAIHGDCIVTAMPFAFESYQKGQVVMFLQEKEADNA
jgi:hypothetical protein